MMLYVIRAKSSYWMRKNNRLLNSLEIRMICVRGSVIITDNQYPSTVMSTLILQEIAMTADIIQSFSAFP